MGIVRRGRLHRQAGLGTIEGLDLAFLIDREHQAVRRRVDIKSDHVAHLDGKLRITAELEDPQPVWGEAMGAPDFLHCAIASPIASAIARLVQCVVRRRRAERAGDQAADHRVGDRRFAGLPRLVAQQPLNPGAIKRCCQRHTLGLDTPARRMTSTVPQPSAVARMICARHTCFCALLRSATTASSRSRSPGPSRTSMPFCIPGSSHKIRSKGIL